MYKLMTPGPVPIPPDVLAQLATPALHHRTPEFSEVIAETLDNLSQVFQTKQPAMALTGWGSSGMEAALTNTLSPGDKVIVLAAGKFGERWAALANSYGLNTIVESKPWGDVVSAETAKSLLAKHTDAKALVCQACETSSGAFFPVQEIAAEVKNTNAIFIVDAITALGAVDIPMDKWGIDVMIGGSQKAFMLPAGLTFISLSEKAWQFNKQAKLHRYSLDLEQEKKSNSKKQTRFSSPTSMFLGLQKVLEIMLAKGLPEVFAETQKRSDYFNEQINDIKISSFTSFPCASLTCLKMPEGTDAEAIRKTLLDEHGILIAGGQEAFKGKLIRIGHMGYMSLEDLKQTAEGLKLSFKKHYPELVN